MNEDSLRSRGLGLRLLTVGLWVVTSAVAFLEILTVREIVYRVYAHLAVSSSVDTHWREYSGGVSLGIGVAVIMGILCVGVIIGAGEYHLKNFGTLKSWRLFGWTIAAELSILVLALFV